MRGYKEWSANALCIDKKELFDTQPRKAKQTCKGCPVRKDCFQYAMIYDEKGVWGGTTTQERQIINNRSPDLKTRLLQEARQEGIYRARFSIAEYVESLQRARQLHNRPSRVPVDPSQLLAEALELLEELNNLWES